MTHFDVLVLGAGPGGYVAAIRAAQLGKSVAVVEDKYWGGVCLNVGCIPSKALLKNAELAHVLTHEKAKFGIEGDATMSFGPTHARSRQVSAGIVKGVHYLMKKNKITEIDGWGTLTGPKGIDVKGHDGATTSYTFDNLIIAAGATVRSVPGVVPNGQNIVTYEEQILDANLPKSIIIGGSGGFVGILPYTTFRMVVIITAIVLVGFWWLDRTRLGRLKTAIGDDEFIVPVFGVPLTATKLTIFSLGGALGGLAGGLYAHYVLFIRPDDFGFALLIALQLPIVFGGLDRFYGAVFGILILGFLPEFVRGLADYRLIFMAAMTLLILIIRPSGLITYSTVAAVKGGWRRLFNRADGRAT